MSKQEPLQLWLQGVHHYGDAAQMLELIDRAADDYIHLSLDGSKARSKRKVKQPALAFVVNRYVHRVPAKRLPELADKCRQAIAGQAAEFQIGIRPISSSATTTRKSTL